MGQGECNLCGKEFREITELLEMAGKSWGALQTMAEDAERLWDSVRAERWRIMTAHVGGHGAAQNLGLASVHYDGDTFGQPNDI